MGTVGICPHPHLILAKAGYAHDMGLSPLDLKNNPPGLYVL